MNSSFIISGPGLEVIKLEYSLRLKIKRNDWLPLRTRVREQPIIALYFELRMNSSFIISGPGLGVLSSRAQLN